MSYAPPEQFNIADYFLDDRVRTGQGDRTALISSDQRLTYSEVQALANQFANVLRECGVVPEQRVILALPDGPAFAAALFGVLKIGAVVVMVNPYLRPEEVAYFYAYTRASAVLTTRDVREAFETAARSAPGIRRVLVTDTPDFERALTAASSRCDNFPSHRDDPAIWLFSGGTTGRPKAVVQTHTSFANTTECYAKGVLKYGPEDITLSVPKLFFGYATGSNLLFPFSVGAAAVLFPDRCTADVVFEQIDRHRPTILVNVPTMVNQMVSHPEAGRQDLSSLRFATSAGEALPVELYDRWKAAFGVELLDGLGTAEMWHIFVSNRPGDVRPGTLGKVVPGFEVRIRNDAGEDVADDEVGWLWVRGNSRAIGYWQQMERTKEAFRGEWYVSGDMISRDGEGYITYAGRGDDMLKVSGKWLSPQEVENCLLQHPGVKEVAVVGIQDDAGLTKPRAYVVANGAPVPEDDLKAFVKDRLASFKVPREVVMMDVLPRTHLGKVDRGALRKR